MGQVTIYIDDKTEKKMAAAAKSRNVSKSRWVADVINEKLTSEWPQSVVELAGAWPDFPTLEEVRQEPVQDIPRERL